MKDITNEVKDFKKYFIIPKDEVAFIVHSANGENAMECFATVMDLDMNQYFLAVTEEEYNEIKRKKARKLADKAYEAWCKAGGDLYCDIIAEYDAI